MITKEALLTAYANASSIKDRIEPARALCETLADMLAGLEHDARATGINVPCEIAEASDDLHRLRDLLNRLYNDAADKAKLARTTWDDAERETLDATVRAMQPAEVLALIRRAGQ